MATNRTFTMLKPDAVEKGHIGAILEKISASGFRIVAMKLTQMTTKDAQTFYAIHNERPFFVDLVEYMTRGPIVAAILEKDNAVEDFRTLIGATNPADAADGTIRKLFADSISENAVHGSDSGENAAIESAFHFSGREMF
ncbi:nucleoside-diphosphate kinase [Mariniflexile soesokkakense]|uniref:Nucleoside diphosphate kinase n=1 Tax=Mariniflexile soesokkakense TaxID=1343160 RepID=A0ABV0AAB7_9FLAO